MTASYVVMLLVPIISVLLVLLLEAYIALEEADIIIDEAKGSMARTVARYQ